MHPRRDGFSAHQTVLQGTDEESYPQCGAGQAESGGHQPVIDLLIIILYIVSSFQLDFSFISYFPLFHFSISYAFPFLSLPFRLRVRLIVMVILSYLSLHFSLSLFTFSFISFLCFPFDFAFVIISR